MYIPQSPHDPSISDYQLNKINVEMTRNNKKKQKIEIVFDTKKRREYLTGFRKRKQERRKKAKEELELQVKEERQRVKKEVKEGFRDQLKRSFAPIPELDDDCVDNEEEYETENVSVKIVELSTSDLAKQNNWIGENKPKYSDDETVDNDNKISIKINEELIPGMNLERGKETRNTIVSSSSQDSKKIVTQNIIKEFSSKKQIGRFMDHKTNKSLQHSKAVLIKNKLDRLKDKKKARRVRDNRIKLQNKIAKKRGGKTNKRHKNKK